jgi:hypothetical protein
VTFLDPDLMAGAFLGALGGLTCFVALQRHRAAVGKDQVELRSDLQSSLREQEAEWSSQILELRRNVAALELGSQNTDDAARGELTRSVRSQAMQLLRSGISPERAAVTLGIGRREMRLIATVSRTLSIE